MAAAPKIMSAAEALIGARRQAPRICVLTGAGVSTASGIPDYRSPLPPGSAPRRPPIQHGEFLASEAVRRRYWARSTVGFRAIASAEPNAAHRALKAMEDEGWLTGIITQNVDGLHQAAGNHNVIELHGSIWRVLCRGCGAVHDRAAMQGRLTEALENARSPPVPPLSPPAEARRAFSSAAAAAAAHHHRALRPDGDADIEIPAGFPVPACNQCNGGLLMPDVVFFGGSVPKDRVAAAMAMVDAASSLLVAGSSLTVFSGFRFVRHAHERRIPVVLLGRGHTRGDSLAAVKLEEPLEESLPALVAAMRAAMHRPGVTNGL